MKITRLRAKMMLAPDQFPQYIIGAMAGVHPSRLSQYALGQCPIKEKHLLALSTVLECEPEDLLGYIDVEEVLALEEEDAVS